MEDVLKLDVDTKREMLEVMREVVGNQKLGICRGTIFGNYKYKEHEELSIEDGGKYQYGGSIFRMWENDKPTDMYIRQTWIRSGSHYTGYHYEYDELELVEPFEETITIVEYRAVL